MLFDFLNMMGSYEDRKVEYDELNGAVIDTAAVTDSDKPFETGICHPRYNDNKWVIVQLYDSKKEAQSGHKKWVSIFSDPKKLPKKLRDVSSASCAELCDAFAGEEDWRTFEQKEA